MDSTQVFETGFGIAVRKRMPLSGGQRSALAGRLVIGILERLRLCHTPRIVSACCLAEESGIIRNEI